MPTHTLISGDIVAYDAAPELVTFLDRATAAARDPAVSVADMVELLYGEANPLLVRGVIPGRGYVTPEILANPAYRVVLDLLDRKRVALGSLDLQAVAVTHTISVTETARRLGVSSSAIRQAIASGRLAAVKIGGQHWLREEAIASFQVARRGPQPAEERPPVLRVRMGTAGDAALQVRTDGELTIRSQSARGLRTGEVTGWTWVVVKTARKDLGSLRVFELVPGTVEDSIEVGDLAVSGRFEILRKINESKAASAAWKAAGARVRP